MIALWCIPTAFGDAMRGEHEAEVVADGALAMKAVSIRILTPVPGKGTVGIEVPNLKSTMVFLRDILESEEWKKTKARLPLAVTPIW